jgi:sporulation protein YlmC with PRC-barrel domain
MLFSQAAGQKVVGRESAETVGKITDYIIDPKSRQVAAVVLKKTNGDGDTLPWDHLIAFGDDAVIVANADSVVVADGHLAELSEKRFAANGKRVLTTAGVEIGQMKDIDFDPASGAITGLVLKDQEIEGARLMAIGSYAVIVQA